MKKKLIMAALIALCLTAAVRGSLAYFTAEDRAENVITAGNVKIAIRETMETEDGKIVPWETQEDVTPGTTVSKIVKVENTGTNAAWVRVRVEPAVVREDGSAGDPSLLTLAGLDTVRWTERDGYWYYGRALGAGETTEELFTGVVFDPRMDDSYRNSTATVTVYVEATQTANNGASVFEAAGWPEGKGE